MGAAPAYVATPATRLNETSDTTCELNIGVSWCQVCRALPARAVTAAARRDQRHQPEQEPRGGTSMSGGRATSSLRLGWLTVHRSRAVGFVVIAWDGEHRTDAAIGG